MQQFDSLADAQVQALAIVDAIPDPLIVLDAELRILAASKSFYDTFKITPAEDHGRSVFEIGDRSWDDKELRGLLAGVVERKVNIDSFEVQRDFAGLGHRTILLNARLVAPESTEARTVLLGFRDITASRVNEKEKANLLEDTAELLRQQRILFREMQHRVANSLQIIASILMLKARAVASEETRGELEDAHNRVLSVAAVQAHLHSVDGIDRIDIEAYLTKLCAGLSASMIGPDKPIRLSVTASAGTLGSSCAVSLGLIVTELVINAIKHAFPQVKLGASIDVSYQADETEWQLTIADNGVGSGTAAPTASGGLGTAIVAALAQQLQAKLIVTSTTDGRSVVLGPAPLDPTLLLAA
jgi:two-component sensor histidine kinase